MYAEENAQEVENGGNDCRFDDFHVRNPDEFGHEKGRGTHDRRHDLPTGGGGRFDGTCEIFLVPELLHHRDGESTGSDNVCDGRTGNGPFECRRQYGDFCRSPGRPARDGIGDINEEFPEPRLFQIRSKEDEEENKGRGNAHRNPENAFRCKEEMSNHLIQIETTMRQRSGHVRSEETVAHEAEYDDDNRKTDDTTRRFDDHDNPERPDDDIGRRHGARAKDKLLIIEQNVHGRDECQERHHQIHDVYVSAFNPRAFRRTKKIHEHDTERQMNGALNHRVKCPHQAGIQLE